jgi:hypothetical protein
MVIRTFIFWYLVVPSCIAFTLGLIANTCKILADKIQQKEKPEAVQ